MSHDTADDNTRSIDIDSHNEVKLEVNVKRWGMQP